MAAKAETKKDNVTPINKKAGEPKDGYDKLKQGEQDTYDEIGKLGYRPDKVTSGWIASQINGDNRVGPCSTLSTLLAEVKVIAAGSRAAAPKEGDPGVEMVDETSKGRRLPTMEVPSVKELDALIRRRCEAVGEFTRASAKVQEINQECLDAFDRQKQHFVLYAEKKKHIYKSPAGGELRIKHEVTDKVESILDEDEDGE